MDTTLKQDIYEMFLPVWSGAAGRELSEETIVPDALPDVGSVVDAQGILCLRGKETTDAAVALSAGVGISVLYAPADGGGLCCVELELPADIRLEAPGADGDCRTAARMRLISVEARAINSRKLSVRAEIAADAQCWRRDALRLASGLAAHDGQAHMLLRSAEAMTVADVREKTFAVTDEYAVPAGMGGGVRILARRVSPMIDDVKYVSGKVIFRGRAVSELVFADADGASRAGRYETEFSQIMEIDCDAEEASASASLLLTGAYFDMPEYGEGAGRLAAELHFAVQCVCRERRRIDYLADIYSNRTLLLPAFDETAVVSDARLLSMRQTVAGRAEPAAAGETVYACACVGPVTAEEDAVKTSVLVRLVSKTEEGAYTASKCRLSAEFTPADLRDGERLGQASVSVADIYSSGSDVRVALRMDAAVTTGGVIRSVSAVAEDAEAFARLPGKPSAALVRVPAGTELWELARRYGSSPEAIEAANGGRRDGLLLIPKTR